MKDIAKKILVIAGLSLVWTFQYLIWVPTVWVARFFKFGFKLGLFGVILIFIPFVGWVILALMLYNSTGGRKVKDPQRNDYLKPWFRNSLHSAAA